MRLHAALQPSRSCVMEHGQPIWHSRQAAESSSHMQGAFLGAAAQLRTMVCMEQASWPFTAPPGQHETTRVPVFWPHSLACHNCLSAIVTAKSAEP